MEIPLRTAYSQAGRCGMQPKAKHSLRAQAHLSKSRTETVKTETLEKKERSSEGERESARFPILHGSHSVFGYPNNRASERCPVPIDSDKRRSTVS
ncbi:hypothetical protein TNCV_4733351 [Trichonephila clavipes]|nr:hypothetical protein TNCV_4733351 [Trichonephila clavipes]